MNTQPPTTVGCAQAEVASGKPNAHFNLSRGSSATLRPAATADCSRLFSVVAPQPFQPGPDIRNLEDDSQRPREEPVGSPAGGCRRTAGAGARESAAPL